MGGEFLQYEGDFFDGENDDEESLESDLSEGKPPQPVSVSQERNKPAPPTTAKPASRRLRIRPMTVSMAEKHPDVVSILLTRTDGRQLAFVRK